MNIARICHVCRVFMRFELLREYSSTTGRDIACVLWIMRRSNNTDSVLCCLCVRVQSSLYGDWCRKQSQRSLGSDAGSRHHHHHHNHRHRDNCCRLTETRDQVTHVAADVDAEQVPLPVYDADPDRVRDDVIELNVFP